MSDGRDPAIVVEKVSKSFKLPHEQKNSIKSLVLNFRSSRGYEMQRALQQVSFEVNKGEFFGIVGRNGSGKSTLLKLLAGIYSPTNGAIFVNGTLTPFIELGVGFNPELTGRENVFLNGALLGFDRKEMQSMYNDIVEFAELERFMDQKLKNYSSGMQVRLAFSIAIRVKSDILLIDEVLAVGDSAFQRKCYEIFMALKQAGRTIIFVTHDMGAVERFCDRVLVINKGKMHGVYDPATASTIYDELNVSNGVSEDSGKKDEKALRRWGSGTVKVDSVKFFARDKELKRGVSAKTGESFEMRIKLSGAKDKKVIIGLAFEDMFGVNISGPNSVGKIISSNRTIIYKIDKLSLLPGEYKVTTAVYDERHINVYDHLDKAYKFQVTAESHVLYGKVHLFGEWETR
jgi:ABC-2 type transport system ATP-binding protein